MGINDYIFIDGYRRLLEERKKGRLSNIEAIFPVIELRLKAFGGSPASKLSRVNFHVIFSNELSPDIIENQFLNALKSKYKLAPEYSGLNSLWNALITIESLEDLGKKIIESVPPDKRKDYGSPALEGFSNLNVTLDQIEDALDNHYLDGKYLTAIGKTEWESVNWNDASIAEKKTIINGVDFIFSSSYSVKALQNSVQALKSSNVLHRLLDCSDAHHLSNSKEKDRIGKCFTWVKSEATFEGLKQAMFEWNARVEFSELEPIQPIRKIIETKLGFPEKTIIGSDTFCFRGEQNIQFSPYYTCIIGGRGAGKSVLLNLINECTKGVSSGASDRPLLSLNGKPLKAQDYVSVSGEHSIEFVGQNEVEQFAKDGRRLGTAIFARLSKMDKDKALAVASDTLRRSIEIMNGRAEASKALVALTSSEREIKAKIAQLEKLVESFTDADYVKISEELGAISSKLVELAESIEALRMSIRSFKETIRGAKMVSDKGEVFDLAIENAIDAVHEGLLKSVEKECEFAETSAQFDDIDNTLKSLRLSEEAAKAKLEKFLQERGLSTDNINDVSNAKDQIAKLNKDLQELGARIIFATLRQNHDDDINRSTKAYEKALLEALKPINQMLEKIDSPHVKKIELSYEFDKVYAEATLVSSLLNELPKNDGGKSLQWEAVDRILTPISEKDLETHDSFLEAIQSQKDQRKTREILLSHFSEVQNYHQYLFKRSAVIHDVDSYKRIRITYDNRPLSKGSFGQRCTAALVVLLLIGNEPIIIDEPEAHLDSALIAEFLVEVIKNRKKDRQIIFATHNANFVINGDAELINILKVSAEGKTTVIPCTIEAVVHRKELLSLEGGEDAFARREKRYGLTRKAQ